MRCFYFKFSKAASVCILCNWVKCRVMTQNRHQEKFPTGKLNNKKSWSIYSGKHCCFCCYVIIACREVAHAGWSIIWASLTVQAFMFCWSGSGQTVCLLLAISCILLQFRELANLPLLRRPTRKKSTLKKENLEPSWTFVFTFWRSCG